MTCSRVLIKMRDDIYRKSVSVMVIMFGNFKFIHAYYLQYYYVSF